MNTSSETHEGIAPGSDTDGSGGAMTAMPPSWSNAQDRQPFSALPDGWSVIGRCRFGSGGPGPQASGCYALAHPRIGVALIDIVPCATPNAEARLRRALTAAEFWPDFPGTLPVVHDRLDAASLRSLPWVLERWFAALPELTVPGGSAWIEGVRRAMAVDPAWELPGHPKAMQDVPASPNHLDEDTAVPKPVRRPRVSARTRGWGRMAMLPVAFVAVFGLGLVSGVLLLEAPAPEIQGAVVAAAPSSPPSDVPGPIAEPSAPASVPVESAAAQVAPFETPKLTANSSAPAAAMSFSQSVASVPGLEVATATAPVPRPEPALQATSAVAPPAAAVEANPVQVASGPASGVEPMAASPMETPIANTPTIGVALPLAPPRAPTPPVKVSSPQPSRSTPVIDRACSQALFRFQQGERLTVAEQAFIRSGCSTSRR